MNAASDALPKDRFFNRELSWLEFNQRVLDHAAAPEVPVLERAKFLAITASNLDEFFMVRVGGLKLQHRQGAASTDASGMTIDEQLAAVSARCHRMHSEQYEILAAGLEPLLAEAGIARVLPDDASPRHRQAAEHVFDSTLLPVLSPQAVDRPEDFPLLPGLTMHLCVRLRGSEGDPPWQFAFIPLGRSVGRVVTLPSEGGYTFALVEDVVAAHAAAFFPGREVVDAAAFRLTRNADVAIREDRASDLMVGMEEVLESRKASGVVRLELEQRASPEMADFLIEATGVDRKDVYYAPGPLDLTMLFQIAGLQGFDTLRDPVWPPQPHPLIDPAESMFDNIVRRDLLLIHPYEAFDPVVRLIEEAAADPDVLAIKQVLYRTSRNSPIVAALKRAAEHGKYITAVLELKARFDEARNIEWARELEQAGVQVIYGVRGLKTHAKICIIVRREAHGLVRYVHFGTGNYNEATARLYGDVSLLTCDEEFGADATAFFNAVTGASQPRNFRHLEAAPIGLRRRLLALINGETRRCRQGQRGAITAKLNALADPTLIDALYRASQAGVSIRLNVRGVCCLRPGVPGLSENIRIISIVDRFLEHARILRFHHGGDEQVWISSADWMPRNLDRRVELLVPIQDSGCRRRLIDNLETYFHDNVSCWQLEPSGQYTRLRPEGAPPFRAQEVLYKHALAKVRQAEKARRILLQPHQPAAQQP